jgi:cytochrome P450
MQDFIESYLKYVESSPSLQRKDLIGICLDFFEAGGETVGNTLSWFFLYMAIYPKAQIKCQEELHTVLGTDTFANSQIISRWFFQLYLLQETRDQH